MLTFGTVICTYNRAHLLEQCLASWSHSAVLPDQFIIVDATPNAEHYAAGIVEKFAQLFKKSGSEYIITDKPGLTRQRNLGLKKIKTDIVCFADDDTFITSNYISKILEVFETDSQSIVGGVNGVSTGQFDNWQQKNFRLIKNYFRHHFGPFAQRIHIPKEYTKLFAPLPCELRSFPLIHIDRLWGANMNYRTELIWDSGFDEAFQRYGLYEDVDMSVRIGKTHKLVCRLDAEVEHDEVLGKSTRPSNARYFLASWLNSAYIIEKLFPYDESRNSHWRLFQLTKFFYRVKTEKLLESKSGLISNESLLNLAQKYIYTIQNCQNEASLKETFIRLQNEIYELSI